MGSRRRFFSVSGFLGCFICHGFQPAHASDDDVYSDVFYDSYAAIQTHIRTPDGFIVCPLSPSARPQRASVLIPVPPCSAADLAGGTAQHDRLALGLPARHADPGWGYRFCDQDSPCLLELVEKVQRDAGELELGREESGVEWLARQARVYRGDLLSLQSGLGSLRSACQS